MTKKAPRKSYNQEFKDEALKLAQLKDSPTCALCVWRSDGRGAVTLM